MTVPDVRDQLPTVDSSGGICSCAQEAMERANVGWRFAARRRWQVVRSVYLSEGRASRSASRGAATRMARLRLALRRLDTTVRAPASIQRHPQGGATLVCSLSVLTRMGVVSLCAHSDGCGLSLCSLGRRRIETRVVTGHRADVARVHGAADSGRGAAGQRGGSALPARTHRAPLP